MSTAAVTRVGVCLEYQRLLNVCQQALAAWQQRRTLAQRDHLAPRRHRVDLKRHQNEYARVCTLLESHEQTCQTCQYIAKVGGLDFESMSNALNRRHPFS
jgi:hypothetical protein